MDSPRIGHSRLTVECPIVVAWVLALASAAGALSLAPWPHSGFGALFGICAVRIAREDLNHMIVPDLDLAVLALGGLASCVLLPPVEPANLWNNVYDALATALLLGGSFYALAFTYRLLRGREGLGHGDVKLAAAAGLWLPVTAASHAITIAALAALVTVGLLASRRPKGVTGGVAIPFAAFLAPAFWAVWLARAPAP